MLQTIEIIVTGKVQGVFYRQRTKEIALSIGIKGTVRNLPNGSVQIVATGTKEQVDSLLEWCKQGLPKANVTSVNTVAVSLELFNDFSIDRER